MKRFPASLLGSLILLGQPAFLHAVVSGQEAGFTVSGPCPPPPGFSPFPRVNNHCTNALGSLGYDPVQHRLFVTDIMSHRVIVWDFSPETTPSGAYRVFGGQPMTGTVNPDPPNIERNLYRPGG